MRWEQLFADMEAQVAAVHRAEVRTLAADLTRAEHAGVALADRLRAAVGRDLRLRLRAGGPVGDGGLVTGTLVDAAPQWLLLADGPVRRVLVPMTAVGAVGGLDAHVAPAAGQVERRLGLGHALRALARDRVPVSVESVAGALRGRIGRVGADHLDLTPVDAGSVWTVAFDALVTVRSS